MKRREVKRKGEKEKYTHLNAEFQRIARRDKKTFLSDQCKEIEENNRTEYPARPHLQAKQVDILLQEYLQKLQSECVWKK